MPRAFFVSASHRRPNLNASLRLTMCALATLSTLGLAAGCSSTKESAGPLAARATPPTADLSAGKQPGERPQEGLNARGREQFFDPFGDESAEQGTPTGGLTYAATNRTRAWANPSSVSIYGELGGSRPTTPSPYDGAENLMQVTYSSEGADFDPDVTRDGRFMVFASTQHRPTASLYIKRIGSRAITQLTGDPSNNVMPNFSPDGSRVAFASDRMGNWDIFVMNSNGGQPVQITDDAGHELHPSWSPDGTKLVFCRLGESSQRWEIWVADVANPALKRFLGYGLFPRWSPTGEKILFQRSRERGDRLFSVWTMDYVNGEGVNPTEIVSSSVAAVVNPVWAPDGRRIAFATIPNPEHEIGERPNSADLWIINLDGSGRSNLTGGRHVNLMPVWSGDNRIYFVSDRGGRDNVWSLAPEKAIMAATGPGGGNLANVPTGAGQEP